MDDRHHKVDVKNARNLQHAVDQELTMKDLFDCFGHVIELPVIRPKRSSSKPHTVVWSILQENKFYRCLKCKSASRSDITIQ